MKGLSEQNINFLLNTVRGGKEICQIPAHPDYWITNDGTVVSFKRRAAIVLRKRWNSNGRCFYVVDSKCVTAARLIAFAFYPNEFFDGAEADHINNCAQDDFASNIQWLSKTDNCRKQYGYTVGASWTVLSPAGQQYKVSAPSVFAKSHDINPRAFGEMLNQKLVQSGNRLYPRKSVNGWRVIETRSADS